MALKHHHQFFILNSLFYLPLADYYLFNFSVIYILGFANIILLKKISLFKDYTKKNIDFINYLSLLSLVFINIFFYRLAEHGTDRSAQILIFLLFINLLSCFHYKKLSNNDILFMYLTLGFNNFFKVFLFFILNFFYSFLLFLLNQNKKIFQCN